MNGVVKLLVQGVRLDAVARKSVKKKVLNTFYRSKVFLALATANAILQACIDEGNERGDLPRSFFSASAVGAPCE